jgi:hypothetical protein
VCAAVEVQPVGTKRLADAQALPAQHDCNWFDVIGVVGD